MLQTTQSSRPQANRPTLIQPAPEKNGPPVELSSKQPAMQRTSSADVDALECGLPPFVAGRPVNPDRIGRAAKGGKGGGCGGVLITAGTVGMMGGIAMMGIGASNVVYAGMGSKYYMLGPQPLTADDKTQAGLRAGLGLILTGGVIFVGSAAGAICGCICCCK